MKKVEIENGYGYKVYNDKGKLIGYEAQQSGEGMIYKDCDAYEKSEDEICYISEHGFDECKDWYIPLKLARKEGETKRTIMEQVRSEYGELYQLTEEQVAVIAHGLFTEADWAYISTYIDDYDNLDDIILYDNEGLFSERQKEAVGQGLYPSQMKD